MPNAARSPDQKRAALEVARILIDIGAVDIRPEKPYTLTSGWASPVYIDCRRIISYPRSRQRIMELGHNLITQHLGWEGVDTVAGGETAGIPFAAWIADSMHLPMLYVRKKAKGFGKNAMIEGQFSENQRVLLVEDLATDGASKVAFCKSLRDAGLQVSHAFVVFYYGVFPGALKGLEEFGVDMLYLATWFDVLDAAERLGTVPRKAIEEARDFLRAPVSWSADHGGRAA